MRFASRFRRLLAPVVASVVAPDIVRPMGVRGRDRLAERFPFVRNWSVIDESLRFADEPNHESAMPGHDLAEEAIDAFEEVFDDPKADVAAAADTLRRELDAVFRWAADPGGGTR